MDTLIACGQFTTCYKLLDYILNLKKDTDLQENIDTDAIDKLYKLLLKDWKAFNKNPLFFVGSVERLVEVNRFEIIILKNIAVVGKKWNESKLTNIYGFPYIYSYDIL